MIGSLLIVTPLLLNSASKAAPIQVTAGAIGYAMETAERCGVVTIELENAIGRVLSRNPSFEPQMEIAKGRLAARNKRMTVNDCVGIQATIRGLTDAVRCLERDQQKSGSKK